MSDPEGGNPPWLAIVVDTVSTEPDDENARATLGALVAEIAAARPDWRIAIVQPSWAVDLFDGDRPANVRVGRLGGVPRRGLLRWFYLKSTLPRALRRLDVDLVVALGPATVDVRPPTVLLITSADEVLLPTGSGLVDRGRRDRILRSLENSTLIVALSQAAAEAVVSLNSQVKAKVRLAGTPADFIQAIEEVVETPEPPG